MKKLAILLIILLTGMPTFAVVLVYRLDTKFNPTATFSDVSQTTADLTKIKLQTYVVFDITIADLTAGVPSDVNSVRDVNDVNSVIVPVVSGTAVAFLNTASRPAAIITGKINSSRFQILFGDSDVNSVVTLGNSPDANTIIPFKIRSNGSTTHLGEFLFTTISRNIGEANQPSLTLTADLFGKLAQTDIGISQKILVAKSLKGSAQMIKNNNNSIALGSATATLDTKFTKLFNQQNLDAATATVNIRTFLVSKGYIITQQIP